MTETKPRKFRHILVGVDDSPDAQLAFRYAMNRAKSDGSTLTITSILESDEMNVYQALSKDFVHGQRDALVQHVEGYRNLALRFGIPDVSVVVADGDPGETIVRDVILAVKPDLLVVGSLAKKGIRKRFGSQAAYMVKYAPISVQVIR
ncbi:universal stress protein UspA [Secundilactobacillus paracollinoides]|uniref:Universal stress protein UspA n=1 Tax=Secundilactobacillus paracollinoides TaxID=240427 RepID=A0A1B2IXE1_9LACO|nr:universal stress protein [Secundilactobacillus paracollinoides]ANZ60868.1 universal stress protein UspA [Secundilactobacillus paracollinoides]ANZ65255.1 universal stress protein UspA [Secundilactobacillus paracollinoides]ANZ66725.1 universal stress protein UspA [Secundilactobacillus paracollinoides]KRL80780.1 hypothetical protein FC17_GL003152 [Secundilactobacillus paracollinoides DSM 15502 = JCM 11969]